MKLPSFITSGILMILPGIVPNSGPLVTQLEKDIEGGATIEDVKATVHDAIVVAEGYTPDKWDLVLEAFDKFVDAGIDLEQATVEALKPAA